MLFDTQSRERDEDKHYKFLSLRKKTLQPFRESPVNPLIAESLSPKPVVGVYLVAFPALAVGLYIAGYYIDNQTGTYHLHISTQLTVIQAILFIGCGTPRNKILPKVCILLALVT